MYADAIRIAYDYKTSHVHIVLHHAVRLTWENFNLAFSIQNFCKSIVQTYLNISDWINERI
jgi:hypothetical protein